MQSLDKEEEVLFNIENKTDNIRFKVIKKDISEGYKTHYIQIPHYILFLNDEVFRRLRINEKNNRYLIDVIFTIVKKAKEEKKEYIIRDNKILIGIN